MKRESETASAVGAECRPAGAVPADVEGLRDVLLRNGFVECDIPACNCGSWHPRYGLPERWQEVKDALAEAEHPLCNENGNLVLNALKSLIAERDALRGRVVGGAAPGRELNVALLHADETALAANPDTMDFLALRILAAEVRRLSALTSAAPPPDYSTVQTTDGLGNARTVSMRAAPPPVVPQVVQELEDTYADYAACLGTTGPHWKKLARKALDAIAALGAAQRPHLAVGRGQSQHDAGGARSSPPAVPSTGEKK